MDQTGGGYPGVSTADGAVNTASLQYPQYAAQSDVSVTQPTSFDMVTTNSTLQPQQHVSQSDPLVSSDIRPDWQQQIYAELAGNVPVGTSQPVVRDQVPNAAVQFGVPALPQGGQQPYGYAQQQTSQTGYPIAAPTYQPPTPTQPAPHFQISYAEATGEPVPTPTTSTGKRVAIIAVVIIVLLGSIGGTGFGMYIVGKKNGYTNGVADTQKSLASQNTDNTQDTTGDTDSENDSKLLNFEIAQPVYKEEAVSGIVGEQLQLSDGIVLYVKDVERNFQPSDASYSPMPGEELVKVNLLVGNADATQSKVVSNDMFGLRDLSGSLVSPRTDIGNYEGQIDKLEVSSGGKIRMSLVFSVESGATPLTLVRQQAYNLRSLGQTVNMKIEVIFE